ncbi:type I polyketide synthase [Lentzea roselyniae]|uniref:Type I polyketide synthase n=1 Tax=Lentzea roselyniae TaxID=531940 RepID=A0ABP7CDZ8_9PSEU
MFEPIAIVGRGAVLPDALTPDALWDNLAAGRSSLSTVPDGRWRLSHRWAVGTPEDGVDRTWTDIGGYVRDFPLDGSGLDPSFQWVLHGAREALREADADTSVTRCGLVLGNLSLPTVGLCRYAEQVWLGRAGEIDPRNRFSSGLPAHLAAAELGLEAGAFALDAACASSLYAMKLACDRLHDGSAELMLAGGVNCADDLFIHIGFCALNAMSPTGRSRPFHRHADGLVPAEGAAFVALMRLADAVSSGRRILAVIRGIGLSNDGRTGGPLTPAEEGQLRAMREAYLMSGVAPETVSLVECHATGTPVGDAVEIHSMANVFVDAHDLPVGSVKSNVGHLITAAGAAGVLKVIGAMQAGVRPATLYADEPLRASEGTPMRVLQEAEEWPGPRRAAVSAFGFGGTNAHLIMDEWTGDQVPAVQPPPPPFERDQVAVVALSARVGDCHTTHEFERAVLQGIPVSPRCEQVRVELEGLRFPPNDLPSTLAQQLLIMQAAREAADGVRLPRERTMVLVGMGCDPGAARYGARWRVASWLQEQIHDAADDSEELARFRNAFAPALTSSGVLGTMPNMVANRINAQLDLAGPGYAVSAEEASGVVALRLAARAIAAGEADAAVVGAVDLSGEPVHQAALEGLGRWREPGDAAIALVLKRLSDAHADGDQVIAVLDDDPGGEADLLIGAADLGFDPSALFGSAHAAVGLLGVACAAVALHRRVVPRAGAPAVPALEHQTAQVVVTPLGAPPVSVRLKTGECRGLLLESAPRPHVYSGAGLSDVLTAMDTGRESDTGPARLVLLASSPAQHAERAEAARQWLNGNGIRPEGVAFRATPVDGELSFVYTNGSACYPDMGRELMLAFPDVLAEISGRCGDLSTLVGWAYRGERPGTVLDQIWGGSVLGQLHTGITRDLLGLSPTAVLAYSSGESTSLVAMGAWRDVRELVKDASDSALFRTDLAGPIVAVRRVWQRAGIRGERWLSYLVVAPVDEVRAATADEPAVHLMVVNSPGSCVVGGEAEACRRVLAGFGNAILIDHDIAVHAPEVDEVREDWWRLHRRPTHEVPGVRFYSGATGESYVPTPEACADAITAQALGTVDFVRVVENAWRDGVRVFVEHGPRGLCTGWIQRILGDREHVAVALDATDGRAVRQFTHAITDLMAAGVPLDAERFFGHLATIGPHGTDDVPHVLLPAHLPPIALPDPAQRVREMPNAPLLCPPVPPLATRPPGRADRPARDVARAASVMDRQRILNATHAEFLGAQAAVHERFLHMRGVAAAQLRRAHTASSGEGRTGDGQASVLREDTGRSGEVIMRPVESTRPGPKFDRGQLEHLAEGKISELFGELFAEQDRHERQTRMPKPPMLLADRVTGIDAVPASMGVGTIWTETDVRTDSWYLDPAHRMPAGFMVEAGQADLLLISWLGADLRNTGERVYRLLGCELTYHGELPLPGDTLHYEITIDGHGEHDGVRLFFFRYDCYIDGELRLSVRSGQAGFFTDDELANSDGVVWDRPALRGARLQAREAPPWHMRTPDMGPVKLYEHVSELREGYIRTELPISPDDWFFEGHFKNDPCMPGTLMFEGCLQSMARYMTAKGHTRNKDGWRFEPVRGRTIPMRCRRQVTPSSKILTYEVFVREETEDTLTADVLCTVDGVKAFLAEGVGLTTVPDWPYPKRTTPFEFDRESLMACALGRMSDGLGPSYAVFDGSRRCARLPGPPYHFMTGIREVGGPQNGMRIGSHVVAEYDVPEDAWYFEHNNGIMPFGVLMEVALQPCGWLASYAGCPLTFDKDMLFRNLDGTGTVHRSVTPQTRKLTTRSTLTQVSGSAGMMIVRFDVVCEADGEPLFALTATFGYFPPEAFGNQVGLPPSREERAAIEAPSTFHEDVPRSMLTMIDRVTGYWPDGGKAGLGRLRGEKDVNPSDWFFKAHFFDDPVQPGSLGVEAMVQLLGFHLERQGLGNVRLRDEREVTWKYRGQVTPEDTLIRIDLEITGRTEKGATAEAWLWVDDKRIYHVENLEVVGDRIIDLERDSWLKDHCPTWTVPALPMMSTVDLLAGDAAALRDVELHRWVPVGGPVMITEEREGDHVSLLADGQCFATARRGTPGPRPAPFPEVETELQPDPYEAGILFHGPAFQYLTELRVGPDGASATLDAGKGTVPRGNLHQGLLDAAMHVLPHDRYPDRVGFPHRVVWLEIYEPLPDSGPVRVEARWGDVEPIFDVQLQHDDRVLVAFRLVDVLLPKGRLGSAEPHLRRRFLRDRQYAGGLGLSTTDQSRTTITAADVDRCDWLPGTVAAAYGLPSKATGLERLMLIAARDHIGRRIGVHPSVVDLDDHCLVIETRDDEVVVRDGEGCS